MPLCLATGWQGQIFSATSYKVHHPHNRSPLHHKANCIIKQTATTVQTPCNIIKVSIQLKNNWVSTFWEEEDVFDQHAPTVMRTWQLVRTWRRNMRRKMPNISETSYYTPVNTKGKGFCWLEMSHHCDMFVRDEILSCL